MAPAPALALMDELVEEILLRIPPDDPLSLLRAALVCKRWGRIICDPGFRRRFGEFHRTPPMLCLLCSPYETFIPTTDLRPSSDAFYVDVVDARHGRVLCHCELWKHELNLRDECFEVWDPIAGDERTILPLLPRSSYQEPGLPSCAWNAAVLCAGAVNGACDHLDCQSGPFLVVFVANGRRWGKSGICALVYSSEAAAWSQQIHAPHLAEYVELVPSALAGNSICFLCMKGVLKFDLATREMSLIGLPQEIFGGRRFLRVTEDGDLGLATLRSDRLHLWSRKIGPDEDAGWTQGKVIKLKELLLAEHEFPDGYLGLIHLTGSVHGLDVILVSTRVGIFAIHLKSFRVIKVCENRGWFRFTFPYMRFYTPALGADVLSDQEQAPQISDENKILHCAALSVNSLRLKGTVVVVNNVF